MTTFRLSHKFSDSFYNTITLRVSICLGHSDLLTLSLDLVYCIFIYDCLALFEPPHVKTCVCICENQKCSSASLLHRLASLLHRLINFRCVDSKIYLDSIFCICEGRFISDLVEKHKDRFFQYAADFEHKCLLYK